MPARSAGTAPAFVISTYSSEADAPPVTTSAMRSPVDGGHATAATGRRFTIGAGVAWGRGGPPTNVASRSRLASAPNAALLGARMDDLPAGRWRRWVAGGPDVVAAATRWVYHAPLTHHLSAAALRCSARHTPPPLRHDPGGSCLLYTSDAADDLICVD